MNKVMINNKTGAPHECTDCGVAATHVCKECVKDDEEGNRAHLGKVRHVLC
jgi:hypothetical protein